MGTNPQINAENIISWRAISLLLANNEGSIRGKDCPKKYQESVSSLMEVVNTWYLEHVKNISPEKRYTLDEIVNKLKSI